MRIYWTTTRELTKIHPLIFPYNLKSEGMFIAAPGTMIFRSRQEAEDGIRKAQEEIANVKAEIAKARAEADIKISGTATQGI